MAVLDRAEANIGACFQAKAKGVLQLTEEHGQTVLDLRFSGRWIRHRGHLRPASTDDLFTVAGNKFLEHDPSNRIEVSVVPSIGNMAYEMKVNGQAVLWSPYKTLGELKAKPVVLIFGSFT